MPTEIEKEVYIATREHVETVYKAMDKMSKMLEDRAFCHDASKFTKHEFPLFVEYTPKLRGCTYGSDEYKSFLAAMKPALDHHYANNSHHPEHYENGIDGMNLLDVLEMFCDWWASVQRHADGDLMKSIEINTKRFGMSEQLAQIFRNSIPLLAALDSEVRRG